MKVKYLALLLAMIVVAGTIPFLPIYENRSTMQIEPGQGGEDEMLPYVDTDHDGMHDVWESKYGLDWENPLDRDVDMDRDGWDADMNGNVSDDEAYTNYEEFLHDTDPADPDTDRDGMIDSWEVVQDSIWDEPLPAWSIAENLSIDRDLVRQLALAGFPTLASIEAGARSGVIEPFIENVTTTAALLDTLEDIRIDPGRPDGDRDADSDGLENLDEYRLGTDPRDRDTDGDGLLDGAEVPGGTDPRARDSDGDGMWDGWEVEHGLDPLADDADIDSDADGFDVDRNGTLDDWEVFTNLLEWTIGTDPLDPDTDEDGMLDGWEHLLGLDPTSPSDLDGDPDSDNLTNGDEFTNPVDTDGVAWSYPNDPDTDEDGILDGFEINEILTDPTDDDTDDDGMPDGWEFEYALDPVSSGDVTSDGDNDSFDADGSGTIEPGELYGALDEYLGGTSPEARDKDIDGRPDGWDTDGDGMPDGWEVFWGLDPRNMSDMDLDPDADGIDLDGDGLIDLNFTHVDEYWAGTHPFLNDTDGDLMHDGWEAHWGLDPLLDDSEWDLDNDTYDVTGDGNLSKREVLTNMEEWLAGSSPALNDTDADGLPDVWEVFYDFDPAVHSADEDPDMDGYDFDGDGAIDADETFTNIEEFLNSTRPDVNDTDGDGLIDGWEVHYGFDPLNPTDGAGDPDGDGWDLDRSGTIEARENFTNMMEYRNGTRIDHNDTDGDGMLDGWEAFFGLDPLRNDTQEDPDLDGLVNIDEFRNPPAGDADGWLWTDPSESDTDGDGIPDGEEVVTGTDTFVTDPTDPDTDGDGMPEDWELYWSNLSFDPTDPSDAGADWDDDGYDVDGNGTIDPWEIFTNLMEYLNGSSPGDDDTDGDDMLDGWEAFNGMDPTDPVDGTYDNDEDGFDYDRSGDIDPWEKYTNTMEFLNGTRPNDMDTDDDGVFDGWEVHWGFDPLGNDTMADTDPSRGRLKVKEAAQGTGPDPGPDDIVAPLSDGSYADVIDADGANASSHASGKVHQKYRVRWSIPVDPQENDCVNNLTYSVGFTVRVLAGGTGGLTVKLYNYTSADWELISLCDGDVSYSGGQYSGELAWENRTVMRTVSHYLDENDDALVLLSAVVSSPNGAIIADHLDVSVDYVGDGMPMWEEFTFGADPMDWDSDDDGIPDGAEV
ncbi:MAG: hypothetical protein L0Z54_05575 [Thermoplasmata archaeon]|nr:hypothetical protein [Thermoplasmata archaeon]